MTTQTAAYLSVGLEQINYDGTAGHGDGAYFGQSISGQVLNAPEHTWGGHQNRFAKQKNGTLYHLRITYEAAGSGSGAGACMWRVNKRTGVNTWAAVASGTSWDDCNLLIDPRDDAIYVTAWPLGVWTIFTSRDSDWAGGTPAGTVIGGSWDTASTAAQRHYGGVGMGYDGTIGFKASRELPYNQPSIQETTSATKTELMTGKWDITNAKWVWSPFQSRYIGLRHAYDLMYPNPSATLPSGIYASSQYDVHYDTAGYTAAAAWVYLWLGYKQYFMDPYNPDSYWERNDRIQDPNAAWVTALTNNRPESGLIDLQDRMCGLMNVTGDGSGARANGYRFWCADARTGVLIADIPLTPIPTFGNVQLFEDTNGNFWVLWMAQNSASNSSFRIYRIYETLVDRLSPWKGSTFTCATNYSDLSSSLVDSHTGLKVAVQSYPMHLLTPRAGNQRQNNILDLEIACRNGDYVGSGSYGSTNTVAAAAIGGNTAANNAAGYDGTHAYGAQKHFYCQVNFGF